MSASRERIARAALYLGGFLGPFGGGVLVVLIPELQRTFDASASEIRPGILMRDLREGIDKPLLFVDIDGVLSVFGFPPDERPAGRWIDVDGVWHLISATAAGRAVRGRAPGARRPWPPIRCTRRGRTSAPAQAGARTRWPK